jgi:hypothetical protein
MTHVARIGGMRNASKILVGKLEEKRSIWKAQAIARRY